MVRRAAFAAFALIPTLALAQSGSLANVSAGANATTSLAMAGAYVEPKLGAKIPTEVPLTDEKGQTTNFGRLLRGRPVVLLPIFYRCANVCTVEMEGVLSSLAKLPDLKAGRDVDLVAISLNPKETPDLAAAKKAQYLQEFKLADAAKGVTLLTGPEDAVQQVVRAIGFHYTYDPVKDRVNHPSGVFVLTPDGRVSTLMTAGIYPSAQFAKDVRRAAKDEIIEVAPQITMLGCVMTDPITGKRSIVVTRVVQLFAGATVVAILATMAALSLRKRA